MNEMKSYVTIKNITILLLSIISVFFCLKWINSMDGELKVKNKLLEDKVNLIQIERDSLSKNRAYLEAKYDSLNIIINKESDKIDILKKELKISKLDLEKSKKISDSYKNKYDSIDISIKNLRKSPIKRNGSNLMNSLKNKLN